MTTATSHHSSPGGGHHDRPREAGSSHRTRLPYIGALDGIRGLSVVAVLAFHGGFSWASGGFLGVSTFFTLSGFLITVLLLSERSSAGRVDLRAFWIRRFRRLMPAALAGIALAIVYAAVAGTAEQQVSIAGDATAALTYVANWWFLVSGQSYGDLFAAPSPLLHYWSLAIEEQFYLLFPLGVWLATRRHGVERRTLAVGLAALASVSIALPLVFTLSRDQIYYSTPTRAAELLLGALLAVALHSERAPIRFSVGRDARVMVIVAGLGALATTVWLWGTASEADDWLYQGGFALYAVLSCTVIFAALIRGGAVAKVLGLRPLRHLGQISYGLYVYHWPLFLWINEQRTGLTGLTLFALRLAVTLAIAEVSFRAFERPIRHGSLSTLSLGHQIRHRLRVKVAWVAPAVALVLVAGAATVSTRAEQPTDFLAAQQSLESMTAGSAAPEATVDDDGVRSAGPPQRARVAIFGDSTALLTGIGLTRWAEETGEIDTVTGSTRLGCGIGRAAERVARDGGIEQIRPHCAAWPQTWAEAITSQAPNVALVQTGPWEVMDRRLAPGEPFVGPGDPEFDAWLLDELVAAVDVLSADGALVVWLTSPPDNERVNPVTGFGVGPAMSAARFAALNEVIRQLPERRPDDVRVVDLARWVESTGSRDLELRPDGIHFSDQGALIASREFLGAELVDAFDDAVESSGLELRWDPPAEPLRPIEDAEVASVVVWAGEGMLEIAEQAATDLSDIAVVEVVDSRGCGVLSSDSSTVDGLRRVAMASCADGGHLDRAVASAQPHLVVVLPGIWEVSEQEVDTLPESTYPGHWAFNDWARADLGATLDALRGEGARVVVIRPPPARGDQGIRDRSRWLTLGELVRQVAEAPRRASWMTLADMNAWYLDAVTDDDEARPDGLSWSPNGAAQAGGWLAQVVEDEIEASRAPGAGSVQAR